MIAEAEELDRDLADVIRPGTTRGLDFVIIDELRKRTGIDTDAVLKFALGEILCNSLDKEDATEIDIEVQAEGNYNSLRINDNGSRKLSPEDIGRIVDFENKASSKRGFQRVSRGYLGNALKCIFGYSFALAESAGLDPPDILVKSVRYEYRIALKPDRVRGVINSDIVTTKRKDDGFTTFVVRFPKDDKKNKTNPESPSSPSALKDLIFATSMVNPTRKIIYNLFNSERGSLGSAEGGKALRQETSILWYTRKQFEALFEDFLRARPEAPLKEIIALFRGFTSKKIIGEILHDLNSHNHDCRKNGNLQFFPVTPIEKLSREAIARLFDSLRARAKPIGKRSIPSILGAVGKEPFEDLCKRNGWKLRYVMLPGIKIDCPEYHDNKKPCINENHVEFPFQIELAIFDRREDDREGLKVYTCVNFMASMQDVFGQIFDIKYRLGRVSITEKSPVTVVAHLVCPVLRWRNFGKSDLDE